MKKPNLRPCPFCGGEAEMIENSTWTFIACKECSATLPQRAATGNDVGVLSMIEAWNTRHEITCTYDEGEDYHLICSACGWDRRGALIIPNYCPHCGAYVENHSAPEDYEKYHKFGTEEDGK